MGGTNTKGTDIDQIMVSMDAVEEVYMDSLPVTSTSEEFNKDFEEDKDWEYEDYKDKDE